MNATYQRFILALLIVIGGWLVFQSSAQTIQVGSASMRVEVAETREAITKGLSGRKHLGENRGMLFVFEKPENYGFWMRDMNFAIDIIWIGQDKRVVGIVKSVGPETFPAVFYPGQPIQYVLETNAGWSERNNIVQGDILIMGR